MRDLSLQEPDFDCHLATGAIHLKALFEKGEKYRLIEEYGPDCYCEHQRKLLLEQDFASYSNMREWVLSFGSQAEVLEPDELRADLLQQAYWSWYGFSHRVDWCAIFVSWCANECGYIDARVIPKFAGCVQDSRWFKERGLWQDKRRAIRQAPGMWCFLTGMIRADFPARRMGCPTMWTSWKRWKMAESIR